MRLKMILRPAYHFIFEQKSFAFHKSHNQLYWRGTHQTGSNVDRLVVSFFLSSLNLGSVLELQLFMSHKL